MSNNKNVGAGRQSHTTSDGVYLERRYMYLSPEMWDSLHSISKHSGLSASQYLASIIASTGKSTGNNNDSRTRY
jgi:hypothetical protein